VPETAILNRGRRKRTRGEGKKFGGTVSVVTGGEAAKQQWRVEVKAWRQANDKVEILSGLKPAERFVVHLMADL